MELLFKDINLLLDKKLTSSMRGILITIMLVSDKDKKVWEFKLFKEFKKSKIGFELNELQKNGFLRWSGFNDFEKKVKEDKYFSEVVNVVLFMNNLYGTNFKPDSKSSKSIITARIKEYGIDKVKLVIANRYSVWKDDKFMSQYLRPSTVFRASKFEIYYEEASRTKVGESFLSAEKLKLKHNQEITLEIAEKLNKSDTYNIRIYRTDEHGNMRGSGSAAVRYGRDILLTLKGEERSIKRGNVREFIYIYKTN